MNSLSFWLTRLTLLMLFLFLSALLILPPYFLLEDFFGHHATLRTVLGILGLAWFLLISQAAHVIASRMVFENLGFLPAFRLVLGRCTSRDGPAAHHWTLGDSGAREVGHRAHFANRVTEDAHDLVGQTKAKQQSPEAVGA